MLGLYLVLERKLCLPPLLVNLLQLLLILLVEVLQSSVQLEDLLVFQLLVEVEVAARHSICEEDRL